MKTIFAALFFLACFAFAIGITSGAAAPMFATETRNFSIPTLACTGDFESNIATISIPCFEPPEGQEITKIQMTIYLEGTCNLFAENESATQSGTFDWEISEPGRLYFLTLDESALWSRAFLTPFNGLSGSLPTYDGTTDWTGDSGDFIKQYKPDDAVALWSTQNDTICDMFLGEHDGNVSFKCSRVLGADFDSTPAMASTSSTQVGAYGTVKAWYAIPKN